MATYITKSFNSWTEVDAYLQAQEAIGAITIRGYTSVNGAIVITFSR